MYGYGQCYTMTSSLAEDGYYNLCYGRNVGNRKSILRGYGLCQSGFHSSMDEARMLQMFPDSVFMFFRCSDVMCVLCIQTGAFVIGAPSSFVWRGTLFKTEADIYVESANAPADYIPDETKYMSATGEGPDDPQPPVGDRYSYQGTCRAHLLFGLRM